MRSRVELVSVLEGFLDLATFDYKSGKFYDGEAPPARVRNRVKVLASFGTSYSKHVTLWTERTQRYGKGRQTYTHFISRLAV